MKKIPLMTVILITLLIYAGVARAVNCGDIITTTSQLTNDLHCTTNPALTLVGPASLDLNGFTVYGDFVTDNGIVLEGSGATLGNGTVTKFNRFGVILREGGNHIVKNVVSHQNRFLGFEITGANNRVMNSIASENGGNGSVH